MAEKEWSPGSILDVFGDRIARATLVLASGQPVTVQDLADQLDVSDPTIYRRIDPLVDANLLRERQRIDDDGNQPTEYETMLEAVTFAVETSGYTIDIQVRQDLAADFEAMWSDLERVGQRADDPSGSPSFRSHDRGGDLS